MNKQNPLSLAGKLTVAGLITAAGGIVIQIISGVDFPTIPPGLFILLIPAALIAFGRWKWTLVLGAVAGLWLFIGLFLSGQGSRLLDSSQIGFNGLWVQMLGVIVAAVAGIIASLQNYQKRAQSIEQ